MIYCFYRSQWSKNPAIWLDKTIMAYIYWTRIFPDIQFSQKVTAPLAFLVYLNFSHIRWNNSIKKVLKPNFWVQTPFLTHFCPKENIWKLAISCTTANGSLTPCWISEETNSNFKKTSGQPEIWKNKQKGRWKDRRTDRSKFIRPFWSQPSVQWSRILSNSLKTDFI